jgi:DNA-binding FadR family transcriptional regulator
LKILKALYEKSISITVDPDNIESYQMFMECDSQFHNSIFTFIENRFLLVIYKNLNAHMQTVRFKMMNHIQRKLSTTDNDHKMILDALFERNAEKAKKAIENHIQNADNVWTKINQKMNASRSSDQAREEVDFSRYLSPSGRRAGESFKE